MQKGKLKLLPPTPKSHLRLQIDVDMIGALDGAMRHNPDAPNSVNAVPNDANVRHDERAPPGIPLWSVSHAGNPAIMAMTTGSGDPDEDPIGRVPEALLISNRRTSSVADSPTREDRRQAAPSPSYTSSFRLGRFQEACSATEQYSIDDCGTADAIRGLGVKFHDRILYYPTEDPATASAGFPRFQSNHLCSVCSLDFHSSDGLASHALNTSHYAYKCSVDSCGLAFISPEDLAKHVQRGSHRDGRDGRDGRDNREFECTVCEEQHPSLAQLEKHARAANHPTFRCENPECTSAYTVRASYVAHRKKCVYAPHLNLFLDV
jgi:hypothetical protein